MKLSWTVVISNKMIKCPECVEPRECGIRTFVQFRGDSKFVHKQTLNIKRFSYLLLYFTSFLAKYK